MKLTTMVHYVPLWDRDGEGICVYLSPTQLKVSPMFLDHIIHLLQNFGD